MNGGSVLPVNKLSPAYQQVADQLRQLILSGVIESGDRLPTEADLAADFGVSRSTVRESLRVLASLGLINTLRGTTGGTFVAKVQANQVSQYLETSIGLMSGSDEVSVTEMLEAREVLEVPAARLAAIRRQQHHIDGLGLALEREVKSRGRGVKFREHRSFHTRITEAAGNGLLVMMTAPVFGVLESRFLSPDVPEDFWAQVDRDHEEILAAIESGDGDASAQAMLEHLKRSRIAYELP